MSTPRTPGALGRMPADRHVPDVDDLAEYGAAACLAALREEFAESVKQYPQYRSWTEGTTLGVARQRIGDEGFVRAEPGDLLLVKRDRSTWPGMTRNDRAYVPRLAGGWVILLGYAFVDDIPAA